MSLVTHIEVERSPGQVCVKTHVPSNVPLHNQIIPNEHLKTQQYLEDINNWADEHMMKLNSKKTKCMIFNYSTNKQFATNIKLNGEVLKTVDEQKILGTIITSDLSWNKNTDSLVKGANASMRLLHAASKFTRKLSDLKQIYIMFVRSQLEKSVAVWHSGLTNLNKEMIERVQVSSMKAIFKKQYTNYKEALKIANLTTLEVRREKMCLKFAKDCLKIDKLKQMFPSNSKDHDMENRNTKKFKVNHAKTERYLKSSIPFLQRLLNTQ